MCGIVGFLGSKGALADAKILCGATDSIKHRGPDDEGYVLINTRDNTFKTASGKDTPDAVRMSKFPYSPGHEIQSVDVEGGGFNLAFGYRRLSIVDLSPAGHQPMCNSNGSLWIVYNGEIYNHVELREELKRRGRDFITHSDTEVILQAYEEWGRDCLSKFNGMWAFALWDSRRRELFCSRDRFGVKPLYYYWNGADFAFASEIKALLQMPFIKTSPNDRNIYNYLVLGRSEGRTDTFFSDIKQVEQGCNLVLSEGELQLDRYYNLAYTREAGHFDNNALRDYADHFSDIFKNSVSIRLRSDVPVGSCLSGGIDSSAIVCMINRLLENDGCGREAVGERQKTVSACYEFASCDERRFIQEVVGVTNVDSHCVFPSGEKFWQEMDDLIWHQDEPFASTSIYAQWNVMRLAREIGVPVLLDGQGADELLAGYRRYVNSYLAQLLYTGQAGNYTREATLIRRNNQNSLFSSFSFVLPVFNMLPAFLRTWLMGNMIRGRVLNMQDTGMMNSDFRVKYAAGDQPEIETNLQTALWKSEMEYGLKELLRYEDRNSMAFSVETRTPFVDYRLVEYVFSLPACYKIHDGWTKYLLRVSTEGLVPEVIRWRKDKLGFPTPETAWMKHNRNDIRGIFASRDFRASRYLNNRKILENLDKQLDKGSPTDLSVIWKPLNLELWLRKMFP